MTTFLFHIPTEYLQPGHPSFFLPVTPYVASFQTAVVPPVIPPPPPVIVVSGDLPPESGAAGEFLTNNGTTASWAPLDGGTF